MKQLFIVAAIVTLFTTTSKAADINVARPVLESFNTTFMKSANVKWSVISDCYQADFVYKGEYMTALFNRDGELIATTKNITSLELPKSLQKKLKKGLADKWITGLIRVSDERGTTYYVTLENGQTKTVLTSNYTNSWSTVQKIEKA